MRTQYWIFLLLAGIFFAQLYLSGKLYMDNQRLSDNFSALAKETEYYRINDSISAARTDRMLLEAAEIKAYFPEIKNTIEQMNVKMRQLERYSAISSAANYQLANRLQDTVKVVQTVFQDKIVRDTVKLQYITFKDKWIDFRQTIVADSAYTNIQTRDSIAIAQSWKRPNKFLFVRYGRKKHSQTVVNFNPYSKITYSLFIEKK